MTAPSSEQSLSALEYHVLLAMADGPRHGYAIKGAVEAESDGALTPRAASLYRVLGRLLSRGLVREAAIGGRDPHPGRERRYYELTPPGRRTLEAEARRLKAVASLAQKRLRAADGR